MLTLHTVSAHLLSFCRLHRSAVFLHGPQYSFSPTSPPPPLFFISSLMSFPLSASFVSGLRCFLSASHLLVLFSCQYLRGGPLWLPPLLSSPPRVLVSYITSPLFKKKMFFSSPSLSHFVYLYLSGVLHIVLLHIVILLSLPRLTSTSFVLRLLSHLLLTFSSLVFASFSPSHPSSCFHCFSVFTILWSRSSSSTFTIKTLPLWFLLLPVFLVVLCFSRPHPSSDVFFMVYLPSFCSPPLLFSYMWLARHLL